MKIVLSVQSLSFKYPDYPGLRSQQLFSNLSLGLPEAQISLLLGQADTGKSTLCRILMGLLPRFSGGSLQGQVLVNSRSISQCRPFELLQDIGLVFQNPSEQLFNTRCDSEIAFALESLGCSPMDMERRVSEALGWLGIEEFRERNPDTLSGGEKKKLLLACLHAIDPPVWLLDETLEELDTGTKGQLLALLREMKKTVLILSAKWYELFTEFVQNFFLLSRGRVHRIRSRPGSPGFRRLLEQNGFLLPLPAKGSDSRSRSSPAEALMETEGIRFRYQEEGDFSLEIDHLTVRKGKVLAVVGDNGSGKTTLAKLLCGLLVPQQGELRVYSDGSMKAAGPDALSRFTAYIFQDPDLQIFLPTVEEELAYGWKLQKRAVEEIGSLIEKVISLFRLPGSQTPPSLMSYGARKRLQAAVYYLLEKPLVIFDEGDSGLDAGEFCELLRLFKEPDRGLLVITHDLILAERVSDQVILLRKGRIA